MVKSVEIYFFFSYELDWNILKQSCFLLLHPERFKSHRTTVVYQQQDAAVVLQEKEFTTQQYFTYLFCF